MRSPEGAEPDACAACSWYVELLEWTYDSARPAPIPEVAIGELLIDAAFVGAAPVAAPLDTSALDTGPRPADASMTPER